LANELRQTSARKHTKQAISKDFQLQLPLETTKVCENL